MDGDADLVLTGGAVYTVDAARSWAQAVAVHHSPGWCRVRTSMI